MLSQTLEKMVQPYLAYQAYAEVNRKNSEILCLILFQWIMKHMKALLTSSTCNFLGNYTKILKKSTKKKIILRTSLGLKSKRLKKVSKKLFICV